jgi:hypothetical protein
VSALPSENDGRSRSAGARQSQKLLCCDNNTNEDDSDLTAINAYNMNSTFDSLRRITDRMRCNFITDESGRCVLPAVCALVFQTFHG